MKDVVWPCVNVDVVEVVMDKLQVVRSVEKDTLGMKIIGFKYISKKLFFYVTYSEKASK